MRLLARGLAAAVLLIVPLAVVPSASAEPTAAVPVSLHRSGRAVPGQYIITLHRDLDPGSFARQSKLSTLFTYSKVFRGFAATLTAAQLNLVRTSPGVEAVEENATTSAFGTGTGTRDGADRAVATSWGLDRIDQHTLPLDNRFTTAGDGRGATAYIVDTGIDFAHSEFGGRAVTGYDAVGDGRNGQDCNGHGTHVAGTVGGAGYGVAHQATLVSVRVLDCSGNGTLAGVIAGFDWVAAHAQQPAVLNASLGGDASPALDQAADKVWDSGVVPVVAAGNDSKDACRVSPAGADDVVTVGATDRNDQEAGFSNFGPCLSIFAPGTAIVSAKLGGGSLALDGTSMASPHVAGVALLYKAANPAASPEAVSAWLTEQSTKDVLTVTQDSPNRLLFTGGL
ncbi:S8 family peptidase [Streptomyces polygonati]|uniref:S8 family peptidase n=1 Tax=Streptomyces polygonati TaxID=1617087 RepID=A0ABV8HJ53_9ACTN